MKNFYLILFLILLLIIYITISIGISIGVNYENDRISKCIFGNEIGVNYYHFAKIGKCLSK